jgi:hypothetical protein
VSACLFGGWDLPISIPIPLSSPSPSNLNTKKMILPENLVLPIQSRDPLTGDDGGEDTDASFKLSYPESFSEVYHHATVTRFFVDDTKPVNDDASGNDNETAARRGRSRRRRGAKGWKKGGKGTRPRSGSSAKKRRVNDGGETTIRGNGDGNGCSGRGKGSMHSKEFWETGGEEDRRELTGGRLSREQKARLVGACEEIYDKTLRALVEKELEKTRTSVATPDPMDLTDDEILDDEALLEAAAQSVLLGDEDGSQPPPATETTGATEDAEEEDPMIISDFVGDVDQGGNLDEQTMKRLRSSITPMSIAKKVSNQPMVDSSPETIVEYWRRMKVQDHIAKVLSALDSDVMSNATEEVLRRIGRMESIRATRDSVIRGNPVGNVGRVSQIDVSYEGDDNGNNGGEGRRVGSGCHDGFDEMPVPITTRTTRPPPLWFSSSVVNRARAFRKLVHQNTVKWDHGRVFVTDKVKPGDPWWFWKNRDDTIGEGGGESKMEKEIVKFLQVWVIIGPLEFVARGPVNFLTGGRHESDDAIYELSGLRKPLTAAQVARVMRSVTSNPTSGVDDIASDVEGSDSDLEIGDVAASQLQRLLEKLDFERGEGQAMDSRLFSDPINAANVESFKNEFLGKVLVSSKLNTGCMFMDETTVKLGQKPSKVWKRKGSNGKRDKGTVPAVASRTNQRGGDYNMVLVAGMLPNPHPEVERPVPFLMYRLYAPVPGKAQMFPDTRFELPPNQSDWDERRAELSLVLKGLFPVHEHADNRDLHTFLDSVVPSALIIGGNPGTGRRRGNDQEYDRLREDVKGIVIARGEGKSSVLSKMTKRNDADDAEDAPPIDLGTAGEDTGRTPKWWRKASTTNDQSVPEAIMSELTQGSNDRVVVDVRSRILSFHGVDAATNQGIAVFNSRLLNIGPHRINELRSALERIFPETDFGMKPIMVTAARVRKPPSVTDLGGVVMYGTIGFPMRKIDQDTLDRFRDVVDTIEGGGEGMGGTVRLHPKGRSVFKVRGTLATVMDVYFGTGGMMLPDSPISSTAVVRQGRVRKNRVVVHTVKELLRLAAEKKLINEDTVIYNVWDDVPAHGTVYSGAVDHRPGGDLDPSSEKRDAYRLVRAVQSIMSEELGGVKLVTLPKYVPQFNPCENLNGMFKGMLQRVANDQEAIEENTMGTLLPSDLVAAIEEWIDGLDRSYLVNAFRSAQVKLGVDYLVPEDRGRDRDQAPPVHGEMRTEGDDDQPMTRAQRLAAERTGGYDLVSACNDPNLDVAPLQDPNNESVVACVDASNGQIGKVYVPDKHDRQATMASIDRDRHPPWKVVSKPLTLFKQLTPVEVPIRPLVWKKDIVPDNTTTTTGDGAEGEEETDIIAKGKARVNGRTIATIFNGYGAGPMQERALGVVTEEARNIKRFIHNIGSTRNGSSTMKLPARNFWLVFVTVFQTSPGSVHGVSEKEECNRYSLTLESVKVQLVTAGSMLVRVVARSTHPEGHTLILKVRVPTASKNQYWLARLSPLYNLLHLSGFLRTALDPPNQDIKEPPHPTKNVSWVIHRVGPQFDTTESERETASIESSPSRSVARSSGRQQPREEEEDDDDGGGFAEEEDSDDDEGDDDEHYQGSDIVVIDGDDIELNPVSEDLEQRPSSSSPPPPRSRPPPKSQEEEEDGDDDVEDATFDALVSIDPSTDSNNNTTPRPSPMLIVDEDDDIVNEKDQPGTRGSKVDSATERSDMLEELGRRMEMERMQRVQRRRDIIDEMERGRRRGEE